MTTMNDDLDNRFNYHAPSNETIKRAHELVRRRLLEVAGDVVACTPPGREQALFLTKLEEAMFWANAGIARNHGWAGFSENAK